MLRSGERPADEAAFRHQLWRTGFLSPVPPLATIYTELTSTGGLSCVSDPEWSVDPDAWDRDDAIVSYDWTELREARSELQVWQAYQEEVASIANRQLKEVRAVLAILKEGRT